MSEEKKQSPFERLASINVNEHIEKKNNLSYLSWAWAVDQLLRQDPEANWEYKQHQMWGDTVMVFCTVTAFGKAMTAQLPVMDYKNRAIPQPDAFQVNTAMQRCLAKAIALHGLGLYIYAGEDLPESDKGSPEPPDGKRDLPQPRATGARAATVEAWDALDAESQQFLQKIADEAAGYLNNGLPGEAVAYIKEQRLDADEQTALWSRFDSKQRSAMKAVGKATE